MLNWFDVFPRHWHQRVLVFRPGLVPGTIVLVQHALHRAEVTAHAVPPCRRGSPPSYTQKLEGVQLTAAQLDKKIRLFLNYRKIDLDLSQD